MYITTIQNDNEGIRLPLVANWGVGPRDPRLFLWDISVALKSIHKDRARDVSIGICTTLFVENGWRAQVEFGWDRCCEKRKMKQKSYSKKARLKHVFKGTKDPGIGLDA